jgi:hypothetical protein
LKERLNIATACSYSILARNGTIKGSSNADQNCIPKKEILKGLCGMQVGLDADMFLLIQNDSDQSWGVI